MTSRVLSARAGCENLLGSCVLDLTLGLCAKHDCMFAACPPANDRWNPWPFLRRMWDAAVALKTEFTVMLEPDNSLHRGFLHEPPYDAGGLEDANPHLHEETVDYAEFLGAHPPLGIARYHRWLFVVRGSHPSAQVESTARIFDGIILGRV